MGLNVEVGIFASLVDDEEGQAFYSDQIKSINHVLQSSGLKHHDEPLDCPVFGAEMIGYSGLHHLRRLAAHLAMKNTLPSPIVDDASKDQVLERYFEQALSPPKSIFSKIFGKSEVVDVFHHLIVHSDAEGFYLPQDFKSVIFPDEKFGIAGGMIGSSQQLFDEVSTIVVKLELPLDLSLDSEELHNAIANQGESDVLWKKYAIESYTCLALYRAAKHSIEHSAMIVFC